MKNVIYVDVLIILNLYIGFFLLLSTQKILNLSVKKWRMAIACGISGFSSLLIFVDFLPVILNGIKLLLGVVICAVAFIGKNKKLFGKTILTFFVVNFLYGGLMFCLWYSFSPPTMQLKNGIVYFNISALTLAIFTILAYLLLTLFSYLLRKRPLAKTVFNTKLCYHGREVQTQALLDTGNNLTDIFTGLPVMICEAETLKPLLSQKLMQVLQSEQEMLNDNDHTYLIQHKIRILPIEVINGCSALYAFKPDQVVVEKDGNSKICEAMVAITPKKLSSGGDFNAILSITMVS